MIIVKRLIRAHSLLLFAFITFIHTASAQATLGTNLIVNSDAEKGPAGTLTTLPTSIPGWTVSGTVNVLPYNLTGLLQSTDPAPADHLFQYFTGGPNNGAGGTLTQDIDVSAITAIAGGNVKYTAGAFLGSVKGVGLAPAAQMAVAFKNSNGQTFNTVTVGPLGFSANGTSLQQEIGLVPVGTARVTVTLTIAGHCLNAAACASGAADSLSLVLTTLGTNPGSVLGTNLVLNPGAEAAGGKPRPTQAPTVPGWSTANGASVSPYGGTGWISPTDPGPADRGVNLFTGGLSGANGYQDIDVSPAATLIDVGAVTFTMSAWLGGLASTTSPTLTYAFYDWTGTQLATTATLGPASHPGAGLTEQVHAGTLPSGTRRVRIVITFPGENYLADDIAFILATPSGPPVVTPGGIVSASAFGRFTSIAPGSWIEIFGYNLAPAVQNWAGGDFNNGVGPTTLGGVSVSVGGKPAYIDFISPGQINALVSSDAPFTGPSSITVTNGNGTSDPFPIYINQTQAGLLTLNANGKTYVAGINSDGTYALPANAISGVASRPAHVGETITLYGVGFGPVTPTFNAGTIVTAQNQLTMPLQMLIGGAQATLLYYGLAPALTGLYQFNVVVPKVAANNAGALTFTLGSVKGTQSLLIATQN